MITDYWNDPQVRAWDRRHNVDSWVDNIKKLLYTRGVASTHYLTLCMETRDNVRIKGKGVKAVVHITGLKKYLQALVTSRMELLSPIISGSRPTSIEYQYNHARGVRPVR